MKYKNVDPQIPQATKLFGSYPQTQSEKYMQRIPIFGGKISVLQLRAIAQLAIQFTPDTPLHLTTRQNIEFHNVKESDQESLHVAIKDLGFSTFGAGGDSVRNTTVCPCCKYDMTAWDPQPLAKRVKSVLDNSGLLTDMPRKFKLTFSGCREPKNKPYITDIAVMVTDAETVRVVGAGSLGVSPEPGIVLYESLSASEVPALALAALRLFVEHGDRENRRKARLRHIRQRVGNEKFSEMLASYFEEAKKEIGVFSIVLSKGGSVLKKQATIQAVAGNICPSDLLGLCDAVESAEGEIQINLHQGIEVYAKDKISFPPSISSYIDLPVVIACPGNTTCKNGIVNTPAMARDITASLTGNIKYQDKVIAISGCPNNCMHSCVSNVGLTGRVKTIDGERHEAYTLLTGGDNGISQKQAEKIGVYTAAEIIDIINDL